MGGAGFGLRRDAQHQGQDAGLSGRERQTAARGQIQLMRSAPGLDQRRAECGAACRFRARAQHAGAVPDPDKEDLGRVEAELGQARRMQSAGLGVEEILPDPQHGTRSGRTQGERGGKARRRGDIGLRRGIDLMQGGAGNASFERLVQRRRPERDTLRRSELARQPGQ